MRTFGDDLAEHLGRIYPAEFVAQEGLAARVAREAGVSIDAPASARPSPRHCRASDGALLITYGDTLVDAREPTPLAALARWLERNVGDRIDGVHVLPFFPWTSDDGFAVVDHRQVSATVGSWSDIEALARSYRLMVDLVINHVSTQHAWFQQFERGEEPGASAFITIPPDEDLSMVVRPRTHALRRPTATPSGVRDVWATFSHDQVDLDFSNPEVLLATVGVLVELVERGARLVRLDAIAYLWKALGTSCIHLPQTHDVVKLLRLILDARTEQLAVADVALITETNVPAVENHSYFGDGDEADIVYNFPLAPLLVHSGLSGDVEPLVSWASGAPRPPAGCTVLNFVASHDGIGLRPAEGLLSTADIDRLVDAAVASGGGCGLYDTADGPRPYELNVSLFDLMGPARFCAIHAAMLAFAGVPAIYIHSLLATPADQERRADHGHLRAINRSQLDVAGLDRALGLDGAPAERDDRRRVFDELLRLLEARRGAAGFGVERPERVWSPAAGVLAVERGADAERVVVLVNFGASAATVDIAAIGSPTHLVLASWELGSGGVAPAGELELGPYAYCWLSASTAA